MMRQVATIEIIIPNECDWTISDVEKSLIKIGIKCNVTKVMNDLVIKKGGIDNG